MDRFRGLRAGAFHQVADRRIVDELRIREKEMPNDVALADWVKVVQAEKLEEHGERVAFLKSKHGLDHGYGNLVAHSAAGGGATSRGEDPVAAQYEGAKAPLRPAYDQA